MMTSQEAFKIQQKNIEQYKKNNPDIITTRKRRPEADAFKKIGMFNMPDSRPEGYIRLVPQDFLVEEKIKSGDESQNQIFRGDRIIRVNHLNDKIEGNFDLRSKTLYAHLIKVGIPTNIALERIAQYLEIDLKRIGYAGLKDSDAITAQLIAFPKLRISPEEIMRIKIPNLYLTNFFYSAGTLKQGDAEENIFTITVRTNGGVNREIFEQRAAIIKAFGFLNYFQFQRFGGLRLNSARIGKFILQGKYEAAVKAYLFDTSEYNIDLITQIRQKAKDLFPDWQKMRELFLTLPYIFYNELKIIDYLEAHIDDYLGLFHHVKDQTQLWIYAYGSLLFNKYLSEFTKEHGCTHEKFPMLTSDNPDDIRIYQKYLQEDGIQNLRQSLYPFRAFLKLKSRFIDGRIFPKEMNYEFFDSGVIVNFSLPKGSYATTLLSNLFEIYYGFPIPEWVDKKIIDPKEIMGQGSLREITELFKEDLYSKDEFDYIYY